MDKFGLMFSKVFFAIGFLLLLYGAINHVMASPEEVVRTFNIIVTTPALLGIVLMGGVAPLGLIIHLLFWKPKTQEKSD